MAEAPRTTEDLLNGWRSLPLPPPLRPRDTFSLLALLGESESLESLLARVDVTGLTPSDVYLSVLGRVPESRHVLARAPPYDARLDLAAALRSTEFQQRSPTLFLRAHPDHRRLIFVHLPKCAGSDLELLLAPRHIAIPEALRAPDWIGTDALLRVLGGYANMARFVDAIFHFGHINVDAYRNEVGVRATDRFLTILREPVDIMLSSANYIVQRLVTDPRLSRPDTRHWASLLSGESLPQDLDSPKARDLALRLVDDPRFVNPDPMCSYLGSGSAERALDNLAVLNFEITTVCRYDRWLVERWGIGASPRFNQSVPLLTRSTAIAALPRLADKTGEDRRLYDVVAGALLRTETASIFGADLR